MSKLLSRIGRLPKALFASRSQFAGEPADLAVQARDRIFVVMFGIATLFAIIEFRLIYLAVNGDEPPSAKGTSGKKPKAQSHIRQARPKGTGKKVKPSSPMADMLKKLLGGD